MTWGGCEGLALTRMLSGRCYIDFCNCLIHSELLNSVWVSGQKCKRLRSYVLTRFERLSTFVFQNPNESKNGGKRNGRISSSRKTV